jgi:peptide/nickel transport system permease protein
MTVNFISAVLVLIGTFVSDLLYLIVDPRIRF